MRVRGLGVALMMLAACGPASAQNAVFRKDSIFFFGGAHSSGNMGQSLNPFYKHEQSYIVGGAWRHDLADLGQFLVLSGEAGLGGRFVNGASAEFWAGPSLRLRAIPIGNFVAISPALTVGVSAVTRPIDIERRHEIEHGGNATVLYYFSPELAFRFNAWPNAEVVYRLHHRSGLYNSLGKMQEGSNAHLLGLRWRL